MTDNTDILIIDISGPDIDSFQIINVYNEKGLDTNTSYIIERSLQNLQLSKETLIVGDFNAYHSW